MATSPQNSGQGFRQVVDAINNLVTIIGGLNQLIGKTFKNLKAHTLLGNPTAAPASVQPITLGATLQFSGPVLQTGAGTSDVTWSANSYVTTISANAVTFGKLQQIAADTIVGNNTAGTANASALTVAQTMALLNAASLVTQDQTLSGGANVTSLSLSTGNVAIDCGKCPLQFITNGGAYTITAPSSDGSCLLLVTNNGSAGATTFSGFTVGSVTGDPLDTTNAHKFAINIFRINGTSSYVIKALQ